MSGPGWVTTLALGVLEIPQNQSLSSRQLLRPRSATGDGPFLLALANNDRNAATTFITEAMTANEVEFTQTESDDFTLIEDPSDTGGFVVVRGRRDSRQQSARYDCRRWRARWQPG